MARIFLLAGELSGDLIASHLATELKRQQPDLILVGVGSKRLRAVGVELIADSTTWSAIGLIEGIRTGLRIRPHILRLERYLRENPPDVFIPVDFPFVNLKMLRVAKSVGARVAYLSAPVSWQWLGSLPLLRSSSPPELAKIIKMRDLVDIAFPLYPFALPFYEKAGVPAMYFGHPEVTRLRELSIRWKEESALLQLAVFPGSRIREIHDHLPIVLRALARWSQEVPVPNIRISVAHPALEPHIRLTVQSFRVQWATPSEFYWRGIRITLDASDAVELMTESLLSVVVSGTILHQAMAVGAPAIAIYRVPVLLAEFTRAFLLNLPFYTLPNLLAGREICPELIQEHLNHIRLAECLRFLWHNPVRRAQVSQDLITAGDLLHFPGGIQEMAKYILQWL